MSALPSQITSTLQVMGVDLALQLKTDFGVPEVKALDLDDFLNISDEVAGRVPATVVQLLSCTPSMRDPLYVVAFMIGFKVGDDSGGYRMMKAMDRIFSMLQVGTQIDVKDYVVAAGTVTESTPATAVMTVSEATLLDQVPEVTSLIRMYAVTCQCLNLQ